MKKIVFLMLVLVPVLAGRAQDTLQDPLRDYYYLDPKPVLDSGGWSTYVPITGDGCGIVGKRLVAKHPLKVYGVAACMMTDAEFNAYDLAMWEDYAETFWGNYSDTTLEECYEYLGIYYRSGDSLVPKREVMVHKKYDTVAYYVESGRVWLAHDSNFIYPMYEKYFDEPISVHDTFYVTVTQRSEVDPFGFPGTPHMGVNTLSLRNVGFYECHVSKMCWPEEGPVHWDLGETMYNAPDKNFYLLFPILSPRGGEEDTTSVGIADMASRYVSVQPNPASRETRVLSSIGMQRIEVYNSEGRRVLDRKSEGVEEALDVSGWPAGTYMLRIVTPLGTTTKKLVVQ